MVKKSDWERKLNKIRLKFLIHSCLVYVSFVHQVLRFSFDVIIILRHNPITNFILEDHNYYYKIFYCFFIYLVHFPILVLISVFSELLAFRLDPFGFFATFFLVFMRIHVTWGREHSTSEIIYRQNIPMYSSSVKTPSLFLSISSSVS